MCFSATASFTAAAITGGIGIATLSKAKRIQEIPIAAMPMIFAVQQAAEGVLWLGFARDLPASQMMLAANLFVLIALAFWPAWSPMAIGLIEKLPARRLMIFALLPVGLFLAGYATRGIFEHPYAASVVGHSICYTSGGSYSLNAVPFYIFCTIAPLFLSSNSLLRKLGGVLMVGLVVSAALFYESFVSVWCFFAAAASVGIYVYFYQRQLAMSGKQTVRM